MSTHTLPRSTARNATELYLRAYWRVYFAVGLWVLGVYVLLG